MHWFREGVEHEAFKWYHGVKREERAQGSRPPGEGGCAMTIRHDLRFEFRGRKAGLGSSPGT